MQYATMNHSCTSIRYEEKKSSKLHLLIVGNISVTSLGEEVTVDSLTSVDVGIIKLK